MPGPPSNSPSHPPAAAPPSATAPAAEAGQLHILDGTAWVMFAFDVGQGVDLAAALPLAGGSAQREPLPRPDRSSRRPEHFSFRPPPMRVEAPCQPVPVGRWSTCPGVELTVFDFGAVSVAYTVALGSAGAGPSAPGDLEALLELAEALYEHAELLADARRRVEALLQLIRPAVRRPGLAPAVEDYTAYHLRRWRAAGDSPWSDPALRGLLARVLRAERHELSAQEVDDALAQQISYSPRGATLIDWNASIVLEEKADDALALLEFANVELLELRHMDDRLDAMLDEAYDASARARRESWADRFRMFPSRREREDLARISRIQVDSALMFESINNTLKLVGDQHLARLHRAAARRLHTDEWDATVLRKVSTLDGIYQKLSEARATRRMEALEWIIILLFVLSILQTALTASK